MRTDTIQSKIQEKQEAIRKLEMRAAGHAPGRITSSYVILSNGKVQFLLTGDLSLQAAISRGWITPEQAEKAQKVTHNYNAAEKDPAKQWIVR